MFFETPRPRLGSASADAIDRTTAVHRRSRTDTDPGRADANTRHGNAGRGLRNMQSRAARCGAEFALMSGTGGTRVRLTLPRRFPDSDAAAG